MTVLGLDIGGTKIAAGLLHGGNLIESIEIPTRADEGFAISRRQVDVAIERLLHAQVTAIGICAPGPLNPISGTILNPPNLPGWRNIPLAAEINAAYRVPCRVENDANAAALAEALWGAARGFAQVFYATLSTGIGTGLVIDGQIYHGKNGAAAEGGHLSLNPSSGVLCNCGLRGCVEALASGTAIARRAHELMREFPESSIETPVTAAFVAKAAFNGDRCAMQVLNETIEYLAQWLGGIVTLFDPAIVVLGGGVSALGELLLEPLRASMPNYTINPHAHTVPIVQAKLGRHAGVYGAAAVML